MKMAESIVCLRLWHDRFSLRYRKAAPTFRWQPLHIVVPKCKVPYYIQQDQFLDLLTNITHHPQNLLTFTNAKIPTALHAYETFRPDLPYPAYVKTQKMTEKSQKTEWKRCRRRQNIRLLGHNHPNFSRQTSEHYPQEVRCFWIPNWKNQHNPRKFRFFLP